MASIPIFNASPHVMLEANEPLLIMCTSGTTAKPKPVVHVHGGAFKFGLTGLLSGYTA